MDVGLTAFGLPLLHDNVRTIVLGLFETVSGNCCRSGEFRAEFGRRRAVLRCRHDNARAHKLGDSKIARPSRTAPGSEWYSPPRPRRRRGCRGQWLGK